jgi:ribosomal protein S16
MIFGARTSLLQLGTYDPIPLRIDGTKEIRLHVDRIKYWLSVGAQPSDRVAYLLWRAGLTPMPPIRYSPSKWVPKKEAKAGQKGFHSLVAGRAFSSAPLGAFLPMTALFGTRFGGLVMSRV